LKIDETDFHIPTATTTTEQSFHSKPEKPVQTNGAAAKGGRMSIRGAVTELNKEIERLTKMRDALLEGSLEMIPVHNVTAANSAAPKKSTPAKKRSMSPALRKRLSDAAKARWAAKKKSSAAK
jgi:hypothetical protein